MRDALAVRHSGPRLSAPPASDNFDSPKRRQKRIDPSVGQSGHIRFRFDTNILYLSFEVSISHILKIERKILKIERKILQNRAKNFAKQCRNISRSE
jgi:hypothetical protein